MKKPGIDDLEALLQLFAASDYTELHFEAAGIEVLLSDDPNAGLGAPPLTVAAGSPAATVSPQTPPSTETPVAALAPSADELRDLEALTAPSLGHFYRSPKPGAAPFVEIGQTVDVHDTVCVIEVMKLFTLLEAGRSGIVRRICVDDGALVEFGQVLMYLEAAPSR